MIAALALAVQGAPSVPSAELDPAGQAIARMRPHTNALLRKKCYPMRKWDRLVREIPVVDREMIRRRTRALHLRVHALPKKPCTAAEIIRAVFPTATENAAISVARCESNLYTHARNPSGASGLFQLMPGWWAGKFNPFDPWANSRFARVLSRDGYDWSHWVCRP